MASGSSVARDVHASAFDRKSSLPARLRVHSEHVVSWHIDGGRKNDARLPACDATKRATDFATWVGCLSAITKIGLLALTSLRVRDLLRISVHAARWKVCILLVS